ncbi:MAG: type II secretion system F family protein, partial [Oscillospiraceae bacterium]
AISENIIDESAKKLIDKLANDVEKNGELYKAFDNAGVFPKYLVNMVKIGEKSGKLEYVMSSLSTYYERENSLKKRITSAILYPFILVIMMCGVIAVLITKVMPIFQDVFKSLGTDMSANAAIIMSIGISVGKVAFILITILAVVLIGIAIVSRTKRGASDLGTTLSKIVFTKKLSQRIASARFASIMSMMFESGYNTDDALDLSLTVISDITVKEKIEKCQWLIKKGKSFSYAMSEVNIFSGIYSRMVSIGTKTGNLDVVMQELANIYHEQADDSIQKAVSFIEPALVSMLCTIIGIILLTVMLPLLNIMAVIG